MKCSAAVFVCYCVMMCDVVWSVCLFFVLCVICYWRVLVCWNVDCGILSDVVWLLLCCCVCVRFLCMCECDLFVIYCVVLYVVCVIVCGVFV